MFVVKVYWKIETSPGWSLFTTNNLSPRLTAPGSPRMVVMRIERKWPENIERQLHLPLPSPPLRSPSLRLIFSAVLTCYIYAVPESLLERLILGVPIFSQNNWWNEVARPYYSLSCFLGQSLPSSQVIIPRCLCVSGHVVRADLWNYLTEKAWKDAFQASTVRES